jgi:hypothetical protein
MKSTDYADYTDVSELGACGLWLEASGLGYSSGLPVMRR